MFILFTKSWSESDREESGVLTLKGYGGGASIRWKRRDRSASMVEAIRRLSAARRHVVEVPSEIVNRDKETLFRWRVLAASVCVWHCQPGLEQTWTNFKIDFALAHKGFQESNAGHIQSSWLPICKCHLQQHRTGKHHGHCQFSHRYCFQLIHGCQSHLH